MSRRTQNEPKSGKSYSLEQIPPELWIKVNQLSFIQHRTLKAIVIESLEDYVCKHTEDLEKALALIKGENE